MTVFSRTIKCRAVQCRKTQWLCLLLPLLWLSFPAAGNADEETAEGLFRHIAAFSADGDRRTGSPGCRKAARYIEAEFTRLGFSHLGRQRFHLPLRKDHGSVFVVETEAGEKTLPLSPFLGNAVSPGTVRPEGLSGPLLWVKAGNLSDYNGLDIEGAIVLMELDSNRNWQHAANFGAAALIYVKRGAVGKTLFSDKFELTPIDFPRFVMEAGELKSILGDFESAENQPAARRVRIVSPVRWEMANAENIYCYIPGSDPEMADDPLVIEAFYDSRAWVAGKSPGAAESLSIATLLQLAEKFSKTPPKRSVLLLATAGHAQSLAGQRAFYTCLNTDPSALMDRLEKRKAKRQKQLEIHELLTGETFRPNLPLPMADRLKSALVDELKTRIDQISRTLMRLRLSDETGRRHRETIEQMAIKRLILRRLSWKNNLANLTGEERAALNALIPRAIQTNEARLIDLDRYIMETEDETAIQTLLDGRKPVVSISLHLSADGDGVGTFNEGWLKDLRPRSPRQSAFRILDKVIRNTAQTLPDKDLFQDTLRPSRKMPWQNYFLDSPALGGEVATFSGRVGVTLATTNDARPAWGTPDDVIARIDRKRAHRQSVFVISLLEGIAGAKNLHKDKYPRNALSVVNGRAMMLRQGELFPDQPAAGTVLLIFQGPSIYHEMADTAGDFFLKGVTTKKVTPHKVIFEGYRFTPETGETELAIDKKQTGKSAYRLKIRRNEAETDLVLFSCRRTTVMNLLEPRTFRYMTNLDLIDARVEADPRRYWYSRIDTWDSTLCSIYLDPGTRFKMILSDSILSRKLILNNADETHPEGTGYPVGKPSILPLTALSVAHDMWSLLTPRIRKLEANGIKNENIAALTRQGKTSLSNAKHSLDRRQYDMAFQYATKSWALASRVYNHVDSIRKDVMIGVLFFIALFVPFAYCLERLVFGFTDIHRRILAFLGVLIVSIGLIYAVHPAFRLAYGPLVVVLAFFIIGLSVLVSLIIFFRFEEEMEILRRRATHQKASEIGRWKAFLAAFFIGVGNLRRRPIRTALTVTTLVILTFTIMSFTTVKTTRHHARIRYREAVPYRGFLLKNPNWLDMPPETLDIVVNAFSKQGLIAPRVWLEADDRTRPKLTAVRRGELSERASGVVGLSAAESEATGLHKILSQGRWFSETDRQAVILPREFAERLGIDASQVGGNRAAPVVKIHGIEFDVIGLFPGERLDAMRDLDGETITPVTFPDETAIELTEVEMEALEEGLDMEAFQSRYRHEPADRTILIPYQTVLSMGGDVKGMAIKPASTSLRADAERFVDRFGFTLYSGEKTGTYLYYASDTLKYSGLPNIAVPMLIAVFIVLNTMIGSVFERNREIAVYTSVGLAPSHVSFLFLAESAAFAVLSVVLGYLAAQTTVALFSGTALMAGITVNYSSLSGIFAMVLVILVVIASTLYPARVASSIAIPDIHRSFQLPRPVGDVIDTSLPFLIKHEEYRSIGAFLSDYFTAHQEVTHGLFAVDDLRIEKDTPVVGSGRHGPDCTCNTCRIPDFTLNARVWLAPFDFGIVQWVALTFCPSARDPGYMEIRVRLKREAGEINAWYRNNRGFLHTLRKQFLIWRSLDETARTTYESAYETMENIPKPGTGRWETT